MINYIASYLSKFKVFMKKYILLCLLSSFLFIPQNIVSQTEKPKVVLVLSGGGAKGLAHIATLQTLDSLGIVPDLIIGTSMGSVVGGLYATGYSGDSIAAIAKKINWNKILGGSISLRNVSVEEKGQFKKYLAEIDLIKGKPKVDSAILNDQKLRELFSLLTFPVLEIKDFNDLPIPFRSMTTDIVNGKEVILDSGSIGLAMRASMSIPGVFSPVPYKNTLLVDGGILNNFAVDVAINMGGDIIIGSDVGGGMQPKEKLNSISGLLFQASMLTSNLKNEESKALCNILIDHVPNISYSTGDFEKGNLIYEQGKIATNQNIKQLVELAERLKQFKQRKHELPQYKRTIVLDSIVYKGISPANLDLVIARTNIKTNKEYVPEDLIEGVERATGTTLFGQITFNDLQYDGKLGLQLNGIEHAKHQVKGSLHYDTYRGIGLVANYTGRNVVGNSSRFHVSLDIAEQPKIRIQYQKNFGKEKLLWWRSDALFEHLIQNLYVAGELSKKMKYNYFFYDNQINKNINSLSSYVGLGINYELASITPDIDPKFSDDGIKLNEYSFNSLEVYAQYSFNNMNTNFYATQGTMFNASIGRSLYSHAELEFFNNAIPTVNSNTNKYTKTIIEFQKRIPFTKTITGIIGANTNFIFEDALSNNDVSFFEYGYNQKYFLGGNLPNQRKNSYEFQGLNEDELNATQLMRLNLAVQFNPLNKTYITPHFDIASVGFDDFDEYLKNAFSPQGNWTENIETSTLISAGVNFSYNSYLGPLNFDLSWVNKIDKIRIFFSLGLTLN